MSSTVKNEETTQTKTDANSIFTSVIKDEIMKHDMVTSTRDFINERKDKTLQEEKQNIAKYQKIENEEK